MIRAGVSRLIVVRHSQFPRRRSTYLDMLSLKYGGEAVSDDSVREILGRLVVRTLSKLAIAAELKRNTRRRMDRKGPPYGSSGGQCLVFLLEDWGISAYGSPGLIPDNLALHASYMKADRDSVALSLGFLPQGFRSRYSAAFRQSGWILAHHHSDHFED